MSGRTQHPRMKKRTRAADTEALIKEIERYRAYLVAIRKTNRSRKAQGGEGSTK
jgi:hypothetical protein